MKGKDMKPKAYFFDLDGTLAAQDQPPSEEDADAIRTLRKKGNLAFLCTGRAPCHVYDSIRAIGFDGFVSAAGAYVTVGNKVIYRRIISSDLLRQIVENYIKNGQTCVLEGVQSLYLIHPKPDWYQQWPVITDAKDFEPSVGRFAGQGVCKFTAYGPINEKTRRLLSSEMDFIEHETYCEVVPSGCCKSDGMRRVLDVYHLERADCVAFGDSRNDLDMLRYAGIGVAMGGSPDVVLRAADRITAPLKEHGVSKALKSIGFPSID